MVDPGGPQMTIWRMLFARWIPKAVDPLEIFNTSYFSTATMVRERVGVRLYLYSLYC